MKLRLCLAMLPLVFVLGISSDVSAAGKAPIVIPGSLWSVPVEADFHVDKLIGRHGADILDIAFFDNQIDTFSEAFVDDLIDDYAIDRKGRIDVDAVSGEYTAIIQRLLLMSIQNTSDGVNLGTLHITALEVNMKAGSTKHGPELEYHLKVKFTVVVTLRGKTRTTKGQYVADGTGHPAPAAG